MNSSWRPSPSMSAGGASIDAVVAARACAVFAIETARALVRELGQRGVPSAPTATRPAGATRTQTSRPTFTAAT